MLTGRHERAILALVRRMHGSPERQERAVRLRAYELWILGGRLAGRDSEYWRQAEEELQTREYLGAYREASKRLVDRRPPA